MELNGDIRRVAWNTNYIFVKLCDDFIKFINSRYQESYFLEAISYFCKNDQFDNVYFCFIVALEFISNLHCSLSLVMVACICLFHLNEMYT